MTWASGQFIIGEQGQNGATVSAWLTSRFTGGTPIAENTALPAGSPDAGPVTTSVDYGGAGFYALELEDADDYAIAIQWDGSIYYFLVTSSGGDEDLPSWFQFGEGTPVGTTVPSQIGALYQDTENGAVYEALGVTDEDWVAVGGAADTTIPGVATSTAGAVSILALPNQSALLSDPAAQNDGSGNGFGWYPGGVDGDQQVRWQTGAPDSPLSGSIDEDGNMNVANWLRLGGSGTAMHFVTTDPNDAESGQEGDVAWRIDTETWWGCTVTEFDSAATWVELTPSQWGQVSGAKYTYAGDPNGHVTPDAEGDLCIDTATPALYQATGTEDTDWEVIGAASLPSWFLVSSGNGSHGKPLGAVTPPTDSIPYLYWDDTDGTGLWITPPSADDTAWVGLGQLTGSPEPGLGFTGSYAFLAGLQPVLQRLEDAAIVAEVALSASGASWLGLYGLVVDGSGSGLLYLTTTAPNDTDLTPTGTSSLAIDIQAASTGIWQWDDDASTWVSYGGGGGSTNTQLAGQAAAIPASYVTQAEDDAFYWYLAFLPPATWPDYTPSTYLPDFTYAEPTLTAVANGVLSIDGSDPSVGEAVVVVGGENSDGVYQVTDAGSVGTPWVLTRVAPFDVAANLAQQLIMGPIGNGTTWSQAIVYWDGANFGNVFGEGEGAVISVGFIDDSSAGGPNRVEGYNNLAMGENSHVEGESNWVLDGWAHAEGFGNQAWAPYAHVEGVGSVVKDTVGQAGHAEGVASVAYLGNGAHAESGSPIAVAGDSQFQRIVAGIQTDMTDTPTQVGSFLMQNESTTALVTVRIVARRIDVPGTDSAWTLQGVLRGDGVSSYSWVGGVAPTPVLVAQDVAAATWAVDVDTDGSTLVVTVTGDSGSQVNWSATVEFDEVEG